MKIIHDPDQIQLEMTRLKREGKRIGFVPTMGNLHGGHLSLIEIAQKQCDRVVVSIFVNPLQFGPNEDFDSYSRTIDSDIKKLQSCGANFLFTPTIKDIYPQGKENHTSVEVNRLSQVLCGASRPEHFKGVTTIVNILFNIIQPDMAVFGKKDYQQYEIIKAMVSDLRMPISIVGAEIVRDANGLAMSSRNGYLSAEEREQASYLRRTLLDCSVRIMQKEPFVEIINSAIESLSQHNLKVDYLKIVRRSNFEPAQTDEKKLLIAAAVWLEGIRLIDNLEVDL